jgi:hypothetical protein
MTEAEQLAKAQRCPACGALNGCAIAAGQPPETCWCMAAPRGLPVTGGVACWCVRCLQRQVALRRPD